MGKNKRKSHVSAGARTTPEEASEIHEALFKHSSRDFKWESLFDQEHSQEELQDMLTTKPHEFKHCKLKMERHDLAYAKPLNDPTSFIHISGTDHVGRSFPGDEVCVQILSRELQPNRGEWLKGKVVGLMHRPEECCTVICRMEGRKRLVTPVKNNMTTICILQKDLDKIEIRKRNPQSEYWFTEKFIEIEEDQLLVVKVLKWEKNRRYPLGVVTNVISHKEYYNTLLELECGIKGPPPAFHPGCDQKEYEKRQDFRNDRTFTIDSSKAEDLDDAFSLTDKGEQYMLAIHITDVASYIRKGSEQDTFAKKQGRTFYPAADGNEAEIAFMLSREASSKYLSLLPGEDRKVISLVLLINKATSMIESSSFTLSLIKSDERLSYEEADRIIEERRLDDNEAPLNFSSVEDCVAVAYCFAKVLRKFRLEGSWSVGQRKGNSRAHCMVEELMNFYNNAVAEELLSNDLTRDLTPLRCHFKPDPEVLELFKRKYSEQLPLSPYLSQICEVAGAGFKETRATESSICVLEPVFEQMEFLTKNRDYHKLVHLIISDEIHPTLHRMAKEFIEIQNKSLILRSGSNLSSRLGHYDLQLNAYTWASSPMRRYLDLILQRLLHSIISGKHQLDMEYTKAEIDQFCTDCDSSEDFDLELLRFINATKPSSTDVTKLAVVAQLAPKEHEFIVSIPLESVPRLMIKYRNLNVVEQPMYNHQDESCTLKWKRRAYSFIEEGKIHPQSEIKGNVIPISVQIWTKIQSAVKVKDWDTISECLQNVSKYDPKSLVNSNAGPTDDKDFKVWKMELKLDDVLQVQLGTEVINGARMPAVNLLTVNASFEVCLEHARNPINCFSHTECRASKTEYLNLKEYREIWGNLCKMDTAYNAVEENNSVILEDVRIKWTELTDTSLKGFFKMTQTQKEDWSLEFDLTNCFLCIRLRDECAEKEEETDATQQYEQAIANLEKANVLVKSIATGSVFNKLYGEPAELPSVYDCMYDKLDLQPLNESQERAVQEALKNPFTLIQGPPGTGKTVVGVHITHHFYMKNKALEEECLNQPPRQDQDASRNEQIPRKRGILYCGPSNKSVDIVAEQLLKLRGVLKPLRIYCDQMEMRSYPYPSSDLKLCRRSLRDEKPKDVLRDISLMDLVRRPENPYSDKIKGFENGTVEFDAKSYRKVLKEAQKHELQKHDVILCTCSTALKPVLMETMDFRQIIIDECAMATEPEAFIPLVSHKPEQIVLLGDHKQIRPIVTCARVKELGMEKSLFERYMANALMLDTQHRMHQSICEFPSKEFYEGKLITETKPKTCLLLNKNNIPTAIIFGHVEGEETSLAVSTAVGNEYSVVNELEAEQAVRIANLLISESRVKPEDVVILTPYNAQMSKIKEMLAEKKNQDVSVCTIMKSQGSEWRYVIISTVRSCTLSEIENEPYTCKGWLGKKLGFVTDPNQVNVAITRAQDGLCILGNRHLLKCSKLWNRLLSHYQEKNCVLDSEDIRVRRA
ncbi:hypothetical protein AMELA_G00143290 [Ameiurus melas]|uniref:RNB domain-containing protein n=1 Tax=Ameiurus melas TaxID=219545 RepID=A0A7J6ANN9_AMEME|nr:hypothetical protein AMELA_G00143290 [Ameiurus melas]